VLVGLLFIGSAYLAMLTPDAPLAIVGAFDQLLGGGGRWVIGVLGLISGLATINVYFASLSRLTWSLSNEGVLPGFLSQRNEYQIPCSALRTLVLISAAMLVASYAAELNFPALLHSVNGAFVILYAASALAAWRLLPRRDRPAIIASLATCLLLAYCVGSAMLFAGVLILLAALILLLRGKHPVQQVVNTVSSEGSAN
jgi:amino acid efflux transporter